MDFPKLMFWTTSVAAVLAIPFGAGLWSAHHENGLYRAIFGAYDDVRTLVNELPNIRRTEPIHFMRPARYPGDGVTVNAVPGGEDDLILMSGFFKDDNKVRLVRRDGTVVNEWLLRVHDIMGDVSTCRGKPATDWNAIPHGTIAQPDGDIVFGFESCAMVRMNRCGKVEWVTDEITHHSPNWMADGNIVISGGYYVDKGAADIPWPFDGPYWEDLVFKFTPDGELVFQKALTELFVENEMAWLMSSNGGFRTRVGGEFHLNEVEELSPELADAFPMFEAGDLMLSLRNWNLVVVTDPEVKKVKWFKLGPFIRQHDPDFQPDGTITVFDNHFDGHPDGARAGGSRVWRIDPATNAAETLYGGTPEQYLYSPERSTHQMLPNDNIMITEAQSGRAFQVNAAREIVWEYINRWDDETVTWVHDAQVYAPDAFSVEDWSAPCE